MSAVRPSRGVKRDRGGWALLAACAVLAGLVQVAWAELTISVTPISLTIAPQNPNDKPATLKLRDPLQSICYHPAGWIALRMASQGGGEIWAGKPDAMHLVAVASSEVPDGDARDTSTLGNPMINAKGQVVYATGKLFDGDGVWVWEAGSEPRRLGGPEDGAWLRPSGSPLIDDAGTVWTFGSFAKWKSSVIRVPADQPPEIVFEFGEDKVPGATTMLARSMYGHRRPDDPQMLDSRMRLDAATGDVAFYCVLTLPERNKDTVKFHDGWMMSRAQCAWVGVADTKTRLINLLNGSRATRSPGFDGLCTASGSCFGLLSWVEPVPGQRKGSASGERTRKGIGYLLASGKSKEVLGYRDTIPGTKAVVQSLERAELNASGQFACTVETDKGIALLAGTKSKTHVVVAPGTTLPGTSGPVTAISSFTVCTGGTLLFRAAYVHPAEKKHNERYVTRLWAWREGQEPVMVLGPRGAPLGVTKSAKNAGPEDEAGEIFIDNAMHGNRLDDDIGQRQLYRVDYPQPEAGVDRRLLLVRGEFHVFEARWDEPTTKPKTK